MTDSETARALERLVRPIRSLSLLAWGGTGLGVGAAILGLLAWTARLGWFDQPWWVLVAWGSVGAATAGLVVAAGRRGAWPSLPGMARQLEHLGIRRRGALTTLIEEPAAGTSPALLRSADGVEAARLRREGREDLAPVYARHRVQAWAGGGVLAAGAIVLGTAGPMRGTASQLWHPGRAWRVSISAVRVEASARMVDRGAHVTLVIEAPGRKSAILWMRAPGESWRGRPVRLDSLGQTSLEVGPLETDLFARATSGSRGSDTVAVRVRIPAFLGSLTISAHYPKYLGLEDEPLPTGADTVPIPAGTRVSTRGEATSPLRTAEWVGRTQTAPLDVHGTSLAGSFIPVGSQDFRLAVLSANGAPLAGDTVRMVLRVVPDSAPRVEVPVPGADTVAPLSLRVPLVIDVRDDHGISKVSVESRRISRLGFEDPSRTDGVPVPPDTPDRAVLQFELDLNHRGLLPGDSLRFFVRAIDNAPTQNAGRSREYVLRLATLSEIRAATRQASEAVAQGLDSVSAEGRKLQRQTEDLATERARTSGERGGNTDESLSFEASKRAESVAAAQEELLKQAESVKEALLALQASAEAAGLNDSVWQQRLEEIRAQLDRAITPELREKLAELQAALKELDPEATKEALANLAEAQKRLREALERSRELFRRAAIEGDLANLAADAKELARQQEEWVRELPKTDSARAGVEEARLAKETDTLATALSRLAQELTPEEGRPGLDSAANRTGEAADLMDQASQSAQSGQRSSAQQRGQQALESLKPLATGLEQQRAELQQSWRQEVLQALDGLLTETARLGQRELRVAEAFQRGEMSSSLRGEQAALEEGAARIQEQLAQVSGKNAMVSPQAGAELAAAVEQMGRAREALATPSPNAREAGERAGDAVDALNAAAYELVRSGGQVSGSASGSGLAEALEQMRQLAARQGQLGQQAGGLLPMAGNSGAIQEQLRRLGAAQRSLAERLERLRASGEIPGAGEMADEAKDLARRLEAGNLDRQTVERQERLFRRMLDAGRTLQGQEEDEKKERQSTTAHDDSIHIPAALRERLGTGSTTYPIPTWETLQHRSPEERRLVVEYFRRLAQLPAR